MEEGRGNQETRLEAATALALALRAEAATLVRGGTRGLALASRALLRVGVRSGRRGRTDGGRGSGARSARTSVVAGGRTRTLASSARVVGDGELTSLSVLHSHTNVERGILT